MGNAATGQLTSATPILDGLAPLPRRPKSLWSTLLQMIIGVVLGVVLAAFGVGLANFPKVAPSPFWPLIFLLDVLLAQALAVVIHECGHLVAGIAAGFRVNFVRFGPLQINPPFKVSLRPRVGIGAAGMASLLPGNQRDLHLPVCIMLLGGPLANIGVASTLYLFFRPLSMFLWALIFICAILGIGNLLPFVRRGAASDGKRILMVLRRTRQGERWLAILKLSADWWKGEQPENFDTKLLSLGIEFTDKLPDTAAIHMLGYTSAFHRHQDAEAARLLEVALAHSTEIPIASRESLSTAAAIFQARRLRNLELARMWLDQLPSKTQFPGLRQQAQAAILECESRFVAAIGQLEESVRLVSTMPPGMQRDLALRSLERWKGELGSQLSKA